MANTMGAYGMSVAALEKTYEEEGYRLQDAADVKTDITFVGIFSNLIKKMDETAQAAQ